MALEVKTHLPINGLSLSTESNPRNITLLNPEEHLMQLLAVWGSCGPTWERTQPVGPCVGALTPASSRLGRAWQAASSSPNLPARLC